MIKKTIQGTEVSKQQEELGGEALLSEVVEHTGLAGTLIESELNSIIESAGHTPADLTLEQLRAAMLSYLEQLNVDLSEEGSEEEPTPTSQSSH